MTVVPLLTTADTGQDLYARVPALATCSYSAYRDEMGVPVRITLGSPRGKVPGGRAHWPTVRSLMPGREYFHTGLPSAKFTERYLADLNGRGLRVIAAELASVADGDTPLVLLCFENRFQLAKDPMCCHRRVFARFWQDMTGRDVPELDN